jgi:hypothetical protein
MKHQKGELSRTKLLTMIVLSTCRFLLPSCASFCTHCRRSARPIVGDPSLDTRWRAVQAVTSGKLVKVPLLKKGIATRTMVSSTETALTAR